MEWYEVLSVVAVGTALLWGGWRLHGGIRVIVERAEQRVMQHTDATFDILAQQNDAAHAGITACVDRHAQQNDAALAETRTELAKVSENVAYIRGRMDERRGRPGDVVDDAGADPGL